MCFEENYPKTNTQAVHLSKQSRLEENCCVFHWFCCVFQRKWVRKKHSNRPCLKTITFRFQLLCFPFVLLYCLFTKQCLHSALRVLTCVLRSEPGGPPPNPLPTLCPYAFVYKTNGLLNDFEMFYNVAQHKKNKNGCFQRAHNTIKPIAFHNTVLALRGSYLCSTQLARCTAPKSVADPCTPMLLIIKQFVFNEFETF